MNNLKKKTCNPASVKRMWGMVIMIAALAMSSITAHAKVVYDFEDFEIGHTFTLWNVYGGVPDGSSAVVETDPANPSNKVLHVIIKGWNTFVELTLPDDLAGHKLTDNVKQVELSLYRPSTDANDYKQFHVYLGSERLYIDDGYPYQGDKGQWQSRAYALNAVAEAADTETRLHLGIHNDDSEYYIDNITLKSEYDDFIVAEANTVVDICEKNTSSTYKLYETPILVNEGNTFTLKSARYSYWNSRVVGNGTLKLMAGGERTFLGNTSKSYPDWTRFSGTLHIYPYKEVEGSCGFYGMIWMHNGKTFLADDAITSADEGKANNCLANAALVLHEGATLAAESGTRGMRIGQLDTEAGSRIQGYYKSNSSSHSYYLVGGSNNDAIMAGRIAPNGDNVDMKVGIIKEGKATLRITGNDNLITGGLTVMQGSVMVNNNAVEAAASKKTGAIGYQKDANAPGVVVRKKGCLGGTGSIGTNVDVYGTLAPGDGSIATLTIADYAKGKKPNLIVRPTAKIKIEVDGAGGSSITHDKVIVGGNVVYYNIDESFAETDKMPQIHIILKEGATLKTGDQLTLVESAGRSALNGGQWQFEIRYPQAYTWEVEETTDAEGKYTLKVRVVSEDYSGQGEAGYEDDDEDNGNEDIPQLDIEAEMAYNTPLRTYAEKKNKFVGTCVPVWGINVDDDNDAKTKLIAEQFNMVVCENEMKFDATEPSQGEFDYYHGDRLVNFANRHGMRVRGHALVWHSQVPGWLTSDGNKNSFNRSREELLAIMKNHIENVVGHWKGKVAEWDVCNEVLSDDQSAVRTDPNAYTLRPSVWQSIGEDFLDSAFVWAHRADPDAVLILNDYGVEFKGKAKAEAFYNLAKKLKERGVPIHGVGLQSHLDVGAIEVRNMEANIKRYNDLGLKCVITELDLGCDKNDYNFIQQARDYYSISRLAMLADNCNELMIWGLDDGITWRKDRNPLLYDSQLNAKPAYYGAHAALRQTAETSAIIDMEAMPETKPGKVVAIEYYNMQGQRMAQPADSTLYIEVVRYDNGMVKARKLKNTK